MVSKFQIAGYQIKDSHTNYLAYIRFFYAFSQSM